MEVSGVTVLEFLSTIMSVVAVSGSGWGVVSACKVFDLYPSSDCFARGDSVSLLFVPPGLVRLVQALLDHSPQRFGVFQLTIVEVIGKWEKERVSVRRETGGLGEDGVVMRAVIMANTRKANDTFSKVDYDPVV